MAGQRRLSGPGPRPHRDRCPVWGCRRVFGVVLEGGTLTSSAAGCGRSLVRRHLVLRDGWRVEADRTERGVVGTLLGPEGTPCGVVFSGRAGPVLPNAPVVGVVVVVGLLGELERYGVHKPARLAGTSARSSEALLMVSKQQCNP